MGRRPAVRGPKAGTQQQIKTCWKTRKLTMEQPSDPSAPHQVIYIVQAAKEKVNIKDAYNVKAATVLGIIHIIFGLISLGIEITNLVVDGNGNVATGIWTSVFFFISGGLAIGGARSGNKCLVVTTLVMAIISAVSAGILLILSTFFGLWSSILETGTGVMRSLAFGLLIGSGATMLIVAIASASLTCKPLCCGSTNQDTVHYNPNLVNQVAALNLTTLQDPQAHPSTSVQVNFKNNGKCRNMKLIYIFQLLPNSSTPPAYQDVAGVGSKYQKF